VNLPFLLAGGGGGSSFVAPPTPGDGYSGTNDQLLEEITKAAFQSLAHATSQTVYQTGLGVEL